MLAERGMSLRQLAAELGMDHAHLSRALRGVQGKRPSRDLVIRIAATLDVPPAFFAEEREAVVIERVRSDPSFRDWLYDRVRTGQRAKKPSP